MRRGWFMPAVVTLLGANTAVYLVSGTPSEALDSAAWFILLALFLLETGRTLGRRAAVVARLARIAAAAALVAALAGYVREEEWLDVLNTALWIAVVALLELKVRSPDAVKRHRAGFAAAAAALYAGLAAVVAAWLWRGDGFGAYDAALWLAAFGALEMNLLGLIGSRWRATAPSPSSPEKPS